jgi:hypothetical protein
MCEENPLLAGIKFCTGGPSTYQAGGLVGPTPPACTAGGTECADLGMTVQCMDTGIAGIMGCLQICQ